MTAPHGLAAVITTRQCSSSHNSIFKKVLMSKQKLKLLATATLDKTPPEKPLVELTEAQLEAIGESQCAERNRWRFSSR